MATLLVDIETNLLTDKERKNPKWFPRWFNYLMTEEERRNCKENDAKFEFSATGSEVDKHSNHSFFLDLDSGKGFETHAVGEAAPKGS
jgi:hypothetical protein